MHDLTGDQAAALAALDGRLRELAALPLVRESSPPDRRGMQAWLSVAAARGAMSGLSDLVGLGQALPEEAEALAVLQATWERLPVPPPPDLVACIYLSDRLTLAAAGALRALMGDRR